uniref:Uncharacterized protein n=1 Tax=Oryza rufipogon TaxID=4529 RepID=A0A0E0QSF5_ORYRU
MALYGTVMLSAALGPSPLTVPPWYGLFLLLPWKPDAINQFVMTIHGIHRGAHDVQGTNSGPTPFCVPCPPGRERGPKEERHPHHRARRKERKRTGPAPAMAMQPPRRKTGPAPTMTTQPLRIRIGRGEEEGRGRGELEVDPRRRLGHTAATVVGGGGEGAAATPLDSRRSEEEERSGGRRGACPRVGQEGRPSKEEIRGVDRSWKKREAGEEGAAARWGERPPDLAAPPPLRPAPSPPRHRSARCRRRSSCHPALYGWKRKRGEREKWKSGTGETQTFSLVLGYKMF